MGFFDKISAGLARSRDKFKESMNVLLDRGPNLDEDFWEGLEETLILSDIGGAAASDIVEGLRDTARRQALPDAYAVLDLLRDQIASAFTEGGEDILGGQESLVLFVGINGTGKTTTVGKIAKEQTEKGRSVILGSADTFRAAAIEQLEVWAQRAGVEMVTRERGSDPASVCYDTIERAEAVGSDLVLIDTAGRLHTSADLMRELEKVVNVVRKRSSLPVHTVLVIDATTGQNGMQQAREFNRALHLDGLIVTKLDGTAKGGIALAVSHELGLPIVKIGVGEQIDDLRDFDPKDFASALIGDFDDRYDEEDLLGQGVAVENTEALDDEDGFVVPAEEATGAEKLSTEGVQFAAGQDLKSADPTVPDPDVRQGDEPKADETASADDAIESEETVETEDAVGSGEVIESEFEEMPAFSESTELEIESESEPEPEPERKKKKHFWEKWW